jgi:hypothetical protein
MNTAYSDLQRKFTELAFDESAEMRRSESNRAETEIVHTVPVTEPALQIDLFKVPGE